MWGVALLLATALHAGFQLTVSCLVYPALAAVSPAGWGPTHAAHSRRIIPLVGLVYGAVMVTAIGSLVSSVTVANGLAGCASVVVFGVTAFVAAPLHGRLGAGPDPDLLRRLLRVDRVRTVGALAALTAAVAAVLG